jgi:hypothetical protein
VRRHELDVASLLGGLLFVLVAAGFLVAEATEARLDPDWVVPAILVGVGAVGLVAVTIGARDGDGDGARDGDGDGDRTGTGEG